MTRDNKSKLNHFIRHSPNGIVLTSEWLNSQGIDYKLTWWYVHSGWLEKLSDKAYKKVGDAISWAGAIAALQQQLELPIYVGGKTALQLLGKAHYLPLAGISTVELFTLSTTRIPQWLTKPKLSEATFRVHKSALFDKGSYKSCGLTKQEINSISLQISAPERAILEVFHDVPKNISYEESLQIMENLARLRPQVVQELLVSCQSIKVKRLFLHAAEKFLHEWINDLDLKKIKLGKGKRRIGQGGNYDPKYQISVPKLGKNDDQ